jgi:hypothetical protein
VNFLRRAFPGEFPTVPKGKSVDVVEFSRDCWLMFIVQKYGFDPAAYVAQKELAELHRNAATALAGALSSLSPRRSFKASAAAAAQQAAPGLAAGHEVGPYLGKIYYTSSNRAYLSLGNKELPLPEWCCGKTLLARLIYQVRPQLLLLLLLKSTLMLHRWLHQSLRTMHAEMIGFPDADV